MKSMCPHLRCILSHPFNHSRKQVGQCHSSWHHMSHQLSRSLLTHATQTHVTLAHASLMYTYDACQPPLGNTPSISGSRLNRKDAAKCSPLYTNRANTSRTNLEKGPWVWCDQETLVTSRFCEAPQDSTLGVGPLDRSDQYSGPPYRAIIEMGLAQISQQR